MISTRKGVMGYLHWWNVNLDPVTMAFNIMAVGFSVDYAAHFCCHYATGTDRNMSIESRLVETFTVRNALCWQLVALYTGHRLRYDSCRLVNSSMHAQHYCGTFTSISRFDTSTEHNRHSMCSLAQNRYTGSRLRPPPRPVPTTSHASVHVAGVAT